MQLVDVDSFQPQPFQAAFNGLAKMRRSGIVSPLVRPGAVPATLRGNDQRGRIRVQGLGDQLFADVWTVRVRSINKVDPQLHGAAKYRQGRVAILGRSPNALASNAHGAEPEAAYGKFAPEIDGAGRVCRYFSRAHDSSNALYFDATANPVRYKKLRHAANLPGR